MEEPEAGLVRAVLADLLRDIHVFPMMQWYQRV